MARHHHRGFSLVELLAVIMVTSILVAIAVPLYLASSRTAMARVCRSNITGIVKVLSGVFLRLTEMPAPGPNGTLPTQVVGSSEGFTEMPKCPLDGSSYLYSLSADGTATVQCSRSALHAADTGMPASTWSVTLHSPGSPAP